MKFRYSASFRLSTGVGLALLAFAGLSHAFQVEPDPCYNFSLTICGEPEAGCAAEGMCTRIPGGPWWQCGGVVNSPQDSFPNVVPTAAEQSAGWKERVYLGPVPCVMVFDCSCVFVDRGEDKNPLHYEDDNYACATGNYNEQATLDGLIAAAYFPNLNSDGCEVEIPEPTGPPLD